MNRKQWVLWAGLLLVGLGALLMLYAWLPTRHVGVLGPTSTSTPEPIVPTPTQVEEGTVAASTSSASTPTGTADPQTPTSEPSPTSTSASGHSPTQAVPTVTSAPQATTETPERSGQLWRGRPRWGVGVSSGPISRYNVAPLRLGWYVDWQARFDPPRPEGVEYAPMVRLKGGVLRPDAETIASVARADPGSLWLIGNEPDVKWQDNVEPAAYADLYHQAYAAIKAADPTARVAIGGVTQPTPLRLRYLDEVLRSYREQFGEDMPVDVWNVHNFILREERGSWGVDIPPGLSDEQGKMYEIDDGDDLEIFRQQIVDFRRWMAERGYGDYPLIVSEYGILMPEEYGFPPKRVADFLIGTFDFFLNATDPELGYSEDGYRLVQRWCWYSLDASDNSYPTGRLFDPETGEMTEVGEAFSAYGVNRR